MEHSLNPGLPTQCRRELAEQADAQPEQATP